MSKKGTQWTATERLAYNEKKMSNKFTASSFREMMKDTKMEEGFDFGVMGKTAWVYDYNSMQMLHIKLI